MSQVTKLDSNKITRTPTINSDGEIEVQLDSLDSSHGFTNSLVEEPPRTAKTNVFKSKIFILTIVFSTLLITLMCIGFLMHYEVGNDVSEDVEFWNVDLPPEQQIWYDRGIDELKYALTREVNRRRAKNVILFVADGMGPNTATAARIYAFKEEGLLSWEKFPHMGMLKTYCANKQICDSMSTGMALFGGVKVNHETGGVDSSVPLDNCTASLDERHHVQTILKWAQIDGMNTGFVTTTRVTHATPAAFYAHIPDRRWECEATMSEEARAAGCKDIGRQLVEDGIGSKINVIMGGGRQTLVSGVTNSTADPIDTWSCLSKDGRDLISLWKRQKEEAGESHAFVENTEQLNKLQGSEVDYVLGIFANGHLKYEHERDTSEKGMPSLKEMTVKALQILNSKNKGFLLMVESGLIDQAHHRGTARRALNEVLALNEAINATIKEMRNHLDETLIIVTADHSHTLTLNGYPDKGADILGVASNSKTEGTPYTTLTYGTSYKGFQPTENGTRMDPTLQNTSDWSYTQQAAINTNENTHGGSDVTIHAMGPMSHLFHGVHEQSYVAHVISFALRIGRFRDSTIAESLAELMPL